MIIEKFEKQVGRSPGKLAVKAGNQSLTYAELNDRANQVAHRILAGDDPAALLFEHGANAITGIIGALKAHKTYVILDVNYPPKRLAYILGHSQASVILTDRVNQPLAESLAGHTARGVRIITIDKISSESPADNIKRDASGDRPAYILYTSGSTGKPKGVVQSHGNVLYFIGHWSRRFSITGADRITLLASLSHDGAVPDIFSALLNGAALFPFDIKRTGFSEIKDFLVRERITIWHSVPTLYRYFTRHLNREDRFPYLRLLVLGGEEVIEHDVSVFQFLFPRAQFSNIYGQTESTVNSIWLISGQDQVKRVGIGEPIGETEILLVDENGGVVEEMGVGEIVIAGGHAALEYWRDKENSEKVFTSDEDLGRLYWTGDLGRLHSDGSIVFIGRKDFQIKIRGFRVETGEIESILLKHPAVKETAVIAGKDENAENYLCAYFIADETLTPMELMDFLSDELPDYMVPGHFIKIDRMPLTASGKINREALPASKTGPEPPGEYEAPGNQMERELLVMWQEVLGVEEIGINSNFFELGGHSLLMMTLAAKIHQAFNVQLQVTDIFDYPTVKELARCIMESEKTLFSRIEPAEEKEYYGATLEQKRIFFLHKFEEMSIAYNLPFAMKIEGEPDRYRFQEIFASLIKRHQGLRTSFELRNEKLIQRIRKEVEFQMKYRDAGKKGMISDDDIKNIITDFIRPFDLSEAPLIRVDLVKLSGKTYLLLLDSHHSIADGVSINILINEFMRLYDSGELPGLRIDYKDYSAWQNNRLHSSQIEQQEDYWLGEFQGEIPVLDLPLNYPRPAIQSFEGDVIFFNLGEKMSLGLNRLAGETDTTLNILLLAIYYILLHKYSGQEDIVIGSITAGRQHAGLESIVGFFVKTFALRSCPAAGKRFINFLSGVKDNTLKAFENQLYPFDRLIEKLDIKKDPSRNPLFDAAFALQNMEITAAGEPVMNTGGSLKSSPYTLETPTSMFDLILMANETAGGIVCWFRYCTKLFTRETIEGMKERFLILVQCILDNTDGRIMDLDILSPGEKNRLLYDFNHTGSGYPEDKTLHRLFAEQVERTPDHVALVGKAGGRRDGMLLSYRELNKKSNQLAHLLGKKGVGGGTIAAIMVEPSVEMAVGILGILKTGGVFLPIDTRYPAQRVSYMLKDSGTPVLLAHGKTAEKVGTGIQNIHLDRGDVFHGNGTNPAPGNRGRDPVYIIYTSGTTGRPKGTVVLHRGLVNLCRWHNRFYHVTPGDNATQYAGPGFDASVWELFPYLIKGARIHIIEDSIKPDIEKLSDYFLRHRISISFLPTQFCRQFMEDAPDIPPLRILLTGGDKLDGFTRRDYRLFNNYGPTENTVVTTAFPVEDRADNIPIGKPVDNTGVYILNKDSLQLQPVGVAGELCISGPGLAHGYLNNPELTAEKFIPNPYLHHPPHSTIYRSGDRARWLPGGNIQFLGRIDDQLKIRGFRIEAGEIENLLLRHEDIKAAVVMARGPRRDLCAYIVPRGKPTLLQLRDYLSARLPDYMVPAYFVLLEKLPLTPSGKPDRGQLPEPEEVSLGAGVEYAAPTTPLEEKLVETWESILGRKPIGIHDDFFLVGGDSIKAIQVASRMNQAGYRMGMRDIFRNPVISELAPQLRESDVTAEQSAVTGVLPLTPIQVEFFKNSLPLPHHYNQAVMLYSKDGFEEDALGPVFGKIQEHHDALRMTYKKEKTGEITQAVHGPDYPLSTRVEDLRNRANAPEALAILADELQESIDLERGPLMKVGLFHLDDGDRLLIVIHHLVIDGISWRILFEDIETLYQQFRNGESFSLPPRTHSFKTWAEKLSQYAGSNRLLSEKTYWGQLELAEVPGIPTDFAGENNVKDTAVLSFSLNEPDTTQLLTTVHEPFGTGINDILLAALAMGIRKTYGFHQVLIALEGHGREDILEGVDINRTVGWFTTVYPVVLDVSFTDTARQVIEVKENLHGVPNRGINYGILKYLTNPQYRGDMDFRLNPRISFNYLGQFDSDVLGKSFGMAPESAGNTRAKNQQRQFELDVSGIISANRLVISTAYSKKQFRTGTIETLMENFKKELSAIISFCVTREKKVPTPSDMDYKNLSIEELDSIFD